MAQYSRRSVLGMGVALAGASAFGGAQAGVAPVGQAQVIMDHAGAAQNGPGDGSAQDERFWAGVARDYEVNPDIINLENGNWGVMSRPVLEAYLEQTRRVNRDNSYFARRSLYQEFLPIRSRVANALGAGDDEIVFTRNATEALQALIGGYQGLEPGQAVMMADLDYGAMQNEMRSLAQRQQCSVVELAVPESTDHDGLIAFYTDALDRHPEVKLLLLTHLSHRTGLMLPVREIVRAARDRGVDVIVDAAHSWGQLPFGVEDLEADFVGFNLHKWIGAPLGVGMAYIRRSRLESIAPNSASSAVEGEHIRGRVHTGTTNFAALLTVPAALDYHEGIGAARKAQRLRYLRGLWVDALRQHADWEILTPDDERLHVGITSLRHRELRSAEHNRELTDWLLKEHGVFTVHRNGVANGACVRITPALYNSPDDISRLVAALRAAKVAIRDWV